MLFHQMIEIPDIEVGWLSDSADSFYYNLGGNEYRLKEIKHGILRGNKKPPGCFQRVLGSKDPKTTLLTGFNDPRILFACPDPPCAPFEMQDYYNHVEEMLNDRVKDFCNRSVCVDKTMGELTLPKIF
jgi:hypothetical protein